MEKIIASAEIAIADDVLFDETFSFENGEDFDDIRFHIIDQAEQALEWEYRIEDSLIDYGEVRLVIYEDGYGQVGEGYIKVSV